MMGYSSQMAGDPSSVTEGIDLARSLIDHGKIPCSELSWSSNIWIGLGWFYANSLLDIEV